MATPTVRHVLLVVSLQIVFCAGALAQQMTRTFASNDYPNSNWSTSCGGTRSNTTSSDNAYQCLREVSHTPGGGQPHKRLEHIWVFSNVPPGVQYLAFEAHAPLERFEFRYNTTGSTFLFANIPPSGGTTWAKIDTIAGASASAAPVVMVPLETTTTSKTFYILVLDTYRAACPNDGQVDDVFIDYLAMATRPAYDSPEGNCTDGIDNDADSLTDCSDPNCQGFSGCGEVSCYDCFDNDSDGQTDCSDADCWSDPVCEF